MRAVEHPQQQKCRAHPIMKACGSPHGHSRLSGWAVMMAATMISMAGPCEHCHHSPASQQLCRAWSMQLQPLEVAALMSVMCQAPLGASRGRFTCRDHRRRCRCQRCRWQPARWDRSGQPAPLRLRLAQAVSLGPLCQQRSHHAGVKQGAGRCRAPLRPWPRRCRRRWAFRSLQTHPPHAWRRVPCHRHRAAPLHSQPREFRLLVVFVPPSSCADDSLQE